MIKLPPELDKHWYNRGYYGTLKHNTRAVYQRYMGWYDGNPTDLDQPAAGGGGEEVRRVHGRRGRDPAEGQGRLRQGRIPLGRRSAQARRLRQSEQQGRQGTAGRCLRAAGLSGRSRVRGARSICRARYELRNGVPTAGGINTASPDTIKAMPPEMLFDYLGRAPERPEGRGQEDRAQHRLHRPEEAVRADRSRTRCSTTRRSRSPRPMPRSR